MGLGDEALRLVRVNNDYQIDLDDLQEYIAADRRDGLQPICVVGNAGTVNTGAFDDLQALSELCQRENCGSTWMAPSAAWRRCLPIYATW